MVEDNNKYSEEEENISDIDSEKILTQDDELQENLSLEPSSDSSSDNPKKKARKTKKNISFLSYVVSIICVALAAVMLTYSCCLNIWKNRNLPNTDDVNIQGGNILNGSSNNGADNGAEGEDAFIDTPLFNTLSMLFDLYSIYDVDDEEMVVAAIKAFVDATGDRYAEYYTPEEWNDLIASVEGQSEGIGINIINSTVNVNGAEIKVFKVINIMKNSPAEGKLKVGDMIAFVGEGDNATSVDSLGYTVALNSLKGAKGTSAVFSAYRSTENGEYELLSFSLERASITTSSVYYHVCTVDQSVGIVKILQFDQTTPGQFCDAIDTLKAAGCTEFVFDMRNNPGGTLNSIVEILSYFLNEGDNVIHTSDRNGNYETTKVEVTADVTKEEIGKYKGMKCAVLCNEYTASAAELFTATFRDYDLAPIIGTKTYGKGSMQTRIPLAYFKLEGGLSLTTKMYYPPCGESYEGEGILPDEVIDLDESLKNINVYEIEDGEDNQLLKALEYLNK